MRALCDVQTCREEFDDAQLAQLLSLLDREVETETEKIKSKYTKLKQQILEKVSSIEQQDAANKGLLDALNK